MMIKMKRKCTEIIFCSLLCIAAVLLPVFISCSDMEPSSGESVTETTENQPDNPSGAVFAQDPDVLSGIFTIDENGTKVRFVKGNLYYDGTAKTWRTEANQYDYRTWEGKNSCINGVVSSTGTPSKNVGQFYWTGSSDKSTAEQYDSAGATTGDSLFTEGFGPDYFVLNHEQMDYLLSTLTTQCGLATLQTNSVSEVKGLVLLPENWVVPDSLTYSAGHSEGWDTNIYTAEQWQTMEDSGAVFFPAYYLRRGNNFHTASNFGGFYWLSTPNPDESDNATAFSFFHIEGFDKIYFNSPGNERKDASFIRLVKIDLQQ